MLSRSCRAVLATMGPPKDLLTTKMKSLDLLGYHGL